MKALSLTRPWTELVLDGHKPIENRTWATEYRGPVIIHAAQSWDLHNAFVTAQPIVNQTVATQLACMHKSDAPLGYLGVVDLVFICRPTHRRSCTCGPWAFKEAYHWHVEHPRRFPEPIPGPGRLGLFVPPVKVIEAVKALGVAA